MFVLSRSSLQVLWTEMRPKGRGEDWRRFGKFCDRTAAKFLLHDSQASDPNLSGKEDQEMYNANVFILLVYDLLGFEISPSDLVAFLEQHAQMSRDEIAHAEIRSNAVPGSESLFAGASAARSHEDVSAALGPARPRSKLKIRTFFKRLCPQGHSQQKSEIRSACEETQSQTGSALGQSALLKLLKERNKTIQRLSHQRKLLKQVLRRKEKSHQKKVARMESKIQELQRRHDFDPHRVSKNWEGRKKWSWLTPQGQANMAAPHDLLQ
eukprot:s1306_g16.t1